MRPAVPDARGRGGRRKKTTVKTTGQLIPQPHGGALRNGGPNVGGPGRPTSAVRELLDAEAPVAVRNLRRFSAKAEKAKDLRTAVAAEKAILDKAMEDGVPRGRVRRALRSTIDIIRAELDPETAERVLVRIAPHWGGV